MKVPILSATLATALLIQSSHALAQKWWFRKVGPSVETAPTVPTRFRSPGFEPSWRKSPGFDPLQPDPPLRDLTLLKARLDPFVKSWNEGVARSMIPKPEKYSFGSDRRPFGFTVTEDSLAKAIEQKERWWTEDQKLRLRKELEHRIRHRLEAK